MAAFPLAVGYKYFDDFGAYLAALLTYYGFVSLFPLLLLLSTVLGLSSSDPLQHEVLTSALHQFPLIGGIWPGPSTSGAARSAWLWGFWGVFTAGSAWPRRSSTRRTRSGACRATPAQPVHARGRSLVLLATVGLALMGTTVLTILGSGGVGALGAVTGA